MCHSHLIMMSALRILPYLLRNSTLKKPLTSKRRYFFKHSVDDMWLHLSNNVALVPQQVDAVRAAWRVFPVSVLPGKEIHPLGLRDILLLLGWVMYAKFGCCTMLPSSAFVFPKSVPEFAFPTTAAMTLTKFSYSMDHGVIGDGCRELNRELYINCEI